MISAIIVAAGRGTRMGKDVDKLFIEVAGRPVVAHTWQRFDAIPSINEIVLVVRDGMQSTFSALAAQFHFQKEYRIIAGGNERQDSVWNGLENINSEAELVAIQDGARPCTSEMVIGATIQAARQVGAAVAAHRVSDTIKESDGADFILHNVDRSRLWAVQTPQVFRVEVIRRALKNVREQGAQVTDDTAACEWIGQPVKLVETSAPNPKVTLPEDLTYVEVLLRVHESKSRLH